MGFFVHIINKKMLTTMMGLALLLVSAAAEWHGSKIRSTPFGPRPSACVRSMPHGSIVRDTDPMSATLTVETPSGETIVHHIPAECNEFAAMSASLPPLGTGPVPDGWVANAGAYYMQTAKKNLHLERFSGEWTVPPTPQSPMAPETLYYFIGLEDRTQGANTSIHQPVLTWGDETEGGIGGWHLWSWTCCPKNVTWHSEDINGFNVGDTIYGRIEKTGVSTWAIDSAFRQKDGSFKNTTLVSQVGDFVYNYASVTLEVYNISLCSQMSSGSTVVSNLQLGLSDKSSWLPQMWYTNGMPNGCKADVKVLNLTAIELSSSGQ